MKNENCELIFVMTPPWQTKMPPLGLAYLASFLKSNNINVDVIDLNVDLFNNAQECHKYFWDIETISNFGSLRIAQDFIKAFNKELENFVDRICSHPAKLVGFSTTVASINIATYLTHRIKSKDPSKIIILGGPGCFLDTCNIDPERVVDIFVIGDGELPLLDIVKRFKDKQSLSDLLEVPGTIICLDKKYHDFSPANPVKQINDIPFPTFSEFELDEYHKEHVYKPIPIITSRGCINKCSFCVDHKLSNPFRFRNPHKIFEEIKYHVENNCKKEFEYNDLLCNGNLKQLEQLCDLIIESGLSIKWTSYAAIRKGMSLELFQKMQKAGCRFLCYGMESASDLVLDKMNKRYNSHTAEDVIRKTHSSGIETGINIIVGHPGESNKEFNQTYRFIKRNKDYIDQITNLSTCFLIPTSDLAENMSNFGIYFYSPLKRMPKFLFRNKELEPNYENFCAYPHNTPAIRAKRARKIITLASKIAIPITILNYQKQHDMGMGDFLVQTQEAEKVFRCKKLKIDFSQKGSGRLYYDNKALTKDVGLNASFHANGRWFDSSSAKCRVARSNRGLEIRMSWPEISLFQCWTIKTEGDSSVEWRVKTEFKRSLELSQYKIGIILSQEYDSCQVNGEEHRFSDNFTENWEEALFLKLDSISIGSKGFLPMMTLKEESKGGVFVQVHNTPLHLHTRMINFCRFGENLKDDHSTESLLIKKGDVWKNKLKIKLKV
ncbi:MAG: B12-binding domain-containing radical SAM protein [Candidatus Omnitrophica bacterium]|nr:B12-binding domain-containing radical SAM protein [Candidatus Omnitrophota bacterium]